jgi:hypothetical protein
MNATSKVQHDELTVVFADLLKLKNDHPKTVPAIQARLVKLGLGKTCGRCGGSGHYSYNQISGTTCFGCGGRGEVVRKLTQPLLTRAKAAVAEGKLDALLEIQAQIKAFTSRRFDMGWDSTGPTEPVTVRSYLYFNLGEPCNIKHFYIEGRPDLSEPLSALTHAKNMALREETKELYNEAGIIEFSRKLTPKQLEERILAFQPRFDAWLAKLTEARREVASHPAFNLERCYGHKYIWQAYQTALEGRTQELKK